MGKMNYYNESTEIERQGQPDLYKVYKKLWPGLEEIEDVRGKDPQYHGIDHIVCMPGNVTIPIQAKVRTTDYEDILLEYISNDRTKSPGWIEERSLAEWFFYLIMPKEKCYYFHWRNLQHLWNINKYEWIKLGEQRSKGFMVVKAKNINYTTISVAVPSKIILDALGGHVIEYGQNN